MSKYLSRMIALIAIFTFAFGMPLFAGGAQEEGPEAGAAEGAAEAEGPAEVDTDAMWAKYITPSMYTEQTGNALPAYNEAPILAERVNAGELPPIEERLPSEPLVVQPVHEIGQYGGILNRAWLGYSDQWGVNKPFGERFVSWNANGQIVPNVPKSWEIVDGGSGIIFNLREGMKWSDGNDLTADDVLFYVNDIKFYDALDGVEPQPWDQMKFGGERISVTKIDDYTVRFDFAIAAAEQFLNQRATWGPYTLIAPSHYLEQFHAAYASESDLNEATEEAGYDDWTQLFEEKNDYLRNPDLPVIFAWKPATVGSEQIFKMERNPYYWKVDVEGNQLPYIDQVFNQLVESVEIINAQALSGAYDLQVRHVKFENFTTLKENEEKGGYRVGLYPTDSTTQLGLYINHTVEDPIKNELFNTQEFKVALSHAIDREEMNELVFNGVGVARNAEGYVPRSPFYREDLAFAYADLDVEKANQLLDEVGLDERGSDGFRLGPDGGPFQVNITATTNQNTDVLELVKSYWENVGIKTEIDQIDRSLYEERQYSNRFELAAWGMAKMLRPDFELVNLCPITGQRGNTYGSAPLWGLWYITDGEQGVEPPAYAKRLQELAEEMAVADSFERKAEIVEEIAQIRVDNLQVIGTVGEIPAAGVISNRLRNAPVGVVWTGLYRNAARTMPCQFYIRE